MSKNIAVIMRAIPGSGKSTLSGVIQSICADLTISIHSTDNKHMVNGEYKFDINKAGYYHKLNLEEYSNSIKKGTNIVICDNTNTTKKEFMPYYDIANSNGYLVIGVIFEPHDLETHVNRNSHNVPKETLEKMINRFSDELWKDGLFYRVPNNMKNYYDHYKNIAVEIKEMFNRQMY